MSDADTWHLPGGLLGRLLRSLLGGRVAYFALFVIVHSVLAFTTAGMTWFDVLELVLICAPQGVLALHRTMNTGVLIVSAVGLVLAAALGIYSLPTDGRWPGYEAWQLGAITISLFGFALIGRYLAAWVVLLAVAGIAIGWAGSTSQGWAFGAGLVDRHFGTLLVGTLFAWSLARSRATFDVYRALERRTRALERAASARSGARRSAAESVLEQAGPMLRAIAEGRPLTETDRREMLVLEGTLRDQIRAPHVAVGPLRDAIADARRRGVNVLLLDETDADVDAGTRTEATAWLADRVASARSERFVGRLRSSDGAVSVTAVDGASSDWATFEARRARIAPARSSAAP